LSVIMFLFILHFHYVLFLFTQHPKSLSSTTATAERTDRWL